MRGLYHAMVLGALAVVCMTLNAAAQEDAAPKQGYDNVVIVLDASGSMNTIMSGEMRRIDAAKKALEQVLLQIPESTHVGLYVFSARNLRENWTYPLGPRDNAALLAAIRTPDPGGKTPLGKSLEVASNRLIEEREKQYGYGSYQLLVVTDGQATDPDVMEKVAPQVIARGIQLDVIGVDMQEDHTLAKIAHSYRRANDAASLTKAVAEALAEVAGSATDTTGEDAFALIAPLPDEMASAMIDALAKPSNTPVSTNPSIRPDIPPVQVNMPATPPPPPPSSNASKGPWIAGFVIFVWVMLSIAGGKRRRRRRVIDMRRPH